MSHSTVVALRNTTISGVREGLLRVAEELDIQSCELSQRSTELKRQANTLLPVSGLPAELLSHIFMIAIIDAEVEAEQECEEEWWYEGHCHADEINFTVSHVCQKWREVAIGTPRLWSEICAGVHTHPDALLAMLKRTSTFPLNMTIDFFSINKLGNAWWAAHNAALQQSTHARSLRIRLHSSSVSRILWPTTPTTVEVLNVVRTVTNSDYGTFDPFDVLATCPRLTNFSGEYLNDLAEWRLPSSLTELRLFECQVSPNKLPAFIATLGTLRSLQCLDMQYVCSSGLVSTMQRLSQVSLPSLCQLNFTTDSEWLFFMLLSHVRFPNSIMTLDLSVEGSTRSDLQRSCISVACQVISRAFDSLTKVTLRAFLLGGCSLKIKGTDESGTRSRTVSLDISYSTYSDPGVEDFMQTVTPHARTLLAGLPMAGVRSVEFYDERDLWLNKRTGRLLEDVEDLAIHAHLGGPSWSFVHGLLQAAPERGNACAFRSLRSLRLVYMDVADMHVDELCEALRSRPLPLPQMTIIFERCRNVDPGALECLECFIDVQWDGKGADDQGKAQIRPRRLRKRA